MFQVSRLPDGQTGFRFQDFVILYRTNAQSRAVEEAFLKAGFPYKIIGGVKFYERKEIKDILAYLKLLANPSDFVSLKRIINTPPRRLAKYKLAGLEQLHQAEKLEQLQCGPPISSPYPRTSASRSNATSNQTHQPHHPKNRL